MADLDKFLPIVHYYARANYPRHLQTACEGVLKRSPGDPVPQFWLAFGKLQEGRHAEAVQGLQMLPPSPEISPATTAAMILAHQSAKIIDYEAVQRLTSQKQMLEESCSSKATIMLAHFYWLSDSIEQARMLVERVVRSPENDQNAQALLGWLMISQKDDEYGLGVEDEIDDAISIFDSVLEEFPFLEALMGKAKALEVKNECKSALEVIREVMARYPWFYPATIECTWTLVRLGQWNEASEMADGILQADSQCIDALSIKALFHFLYSGNNQAGASATKKLENAILSLEPKNAKLCFQTARLIRRVAGDLAPLKELQSLAKCAYSLVPEKPAYACEHGYQQMMVKDFDGALQTLQAASNMAELSLDVMYGTVDCLLQNGMIDEAAIQLEMLADVMTSTEALSETGCLKFELLFYKGITAEEGALMLEKAYLHRQKDLEGLAFGKEFLEKLNIMQILDIISRVLQTLGNTPKLATEAPSPYIAKVNRILSSLLKHAPGHVRCQLLLAQAQYLEGNFEAVVQRASTVQQTCPGDGQASLLLCQVYLHMKKIPGARIALDEAVAASFSIRDLPCYHIVNAQVLMAEGRLDEAKTGLTAAGELPGFKSFVTEGKLNKSGKGSFMPTVNERASVCLLLAEVLEKMQKGSPEAIKVINDALREFEATSEAVRVTIADCELAVNRGDIQTALKKLKKIDPKSPYFSKARMSMANIYLHQKRDKISYVKCYLELSEQHPGFETSLMLGEALMSIQEPEKAIKAFENALEINPKDSDLACRIAEALVTTHEYQKAVDFYKKAIRNSPTHLPLQQKLGSLLVRLKRDNDAIQVFNKSIEVATQFSGAVEQQTHIADTLLLLSCIYKKVGYIDEFLKALKEALSMHITLLSKLRGEHPDIVATRKEKILTLSIKLSQHYIDEQQFSQAEETLLSGMEYCSEKKAIWQTLAKLYLVQGRIADCEEQCLKVLKEDPAHEEAGLMLSEVMFHQGQHSSADTHFLRLLGNDPCDYVALKNLMRVLRYAGRIDEIEDHIKKAESTISSSAHSAGMYFCKGLFHRFKKQQNDALTRFGSARKDPKWATDALYEMVGIILNPEQEVNWLVGESAGECQGVSKSAQSLLEQVTADEKQSLKYKVLWGYATMATKQPGDVQMALSKLLEIASADQNNAPVLLALATGFMLLGQVPKARNQLKRLQKMQVKMEEVDEFERAWLLLADIHMQGGKYDLAQDLCKRCLKYNKSCSKAWECLGQIMEREQSYQDAAEHYESAWRYENEASAEVGYKLAFNFLKAERLVEAIDVCYKVLKEFPDCPRLREDILNKAVGGLRP